MSNDDLREQIAHALLMRRGSHLLPHGALPAPSNYRDADALMPLITQAQARAWDEGWDASVDAANKCDIAGGDPCGDCAICRPPNPYTERTYR